MKFYKTILTLLAMTLAVIGTTATVVHAEGPNINDYMGTETRQLFGEMTPTTQRLAKRAWSNVRSIAPQQDWDEAAEDIIRQFHEQAEERGALLGAQRATGASGCDDPDTYTTLGSSGWAAAGTESDCTMNYLDAGVSVLSYGDTRTCSNCRSVFAYVNGLSCGWYHAYGDHEWGYNPSGGGSSRDSGQAGCY